MTATATAAMTAVTATPTYSSADLYLSAHRSLPPFASSSQRSSSAPLSLSILLSGCSTLPPVPPDFPRSKLIPSTRFVVDGFRRAGDYSVSYFLSHFHYDHYSGLSPSWSDGVVFCSEITARLLVDVLGVPSCFVVALPLDKTVSIDGCDVNLIDANHCPGAVQFLINVPQKDGIWAKYIHTGDFRFCESMKSVSRLSEFIGCDAVFLDTTYCHPKFMFPSQEESVDYVVSVIDRIGAENREVKDKRNVLFVVATYVIGKEKILVDISRRCGCKIFVDSRKRSVLRALGYVDNNLFTADESATNVRVVGWNVLGETWPYFRPNFVNMKKIMEESGYAKIVGFVPTGWTYEVKRNKFAVRTKDSFEIHLVPYSEHSNYEELREYIRFLKPKRVIPTVGLDIEKVDSKHVMKMQKHFAGLVDETANKHTFLMGFKRTCTANDEDKPIIHLDVSVEDRVGVTDKTATGPSSSASVSPASKCSTLLNEEEKVDILQQLHDCLPVWVTRDLMLELIDTVGTNVVEIVSYFYEHETELHDQIKPSGANTGSLMGLEDYSVNDVRFTKSIDLHEVVEVAKIQKPNLLLKLKPTTGSVISPKKRKGNQGDKAKKKTRSYSDPKASGIKQSTITTFFTKMQPCATQHGTAHPVKSEFPEIEDKKPIDVPEQYKEELEQLMCITNGSNASRSFAARAIVKARGDINLALDIYYSGLECKVDDNDGKVDPISKPVLSEGCQQDPCLSPGKVISEAPLNSLDRTVKGSLEENTEAVALPLEKYSQVEHACWRVGQPAPYLHLARTFELVEGEKGRIKASSMLCNMFRSLLALAPEDVLPAAYLCTNKLAADHENMELNIGGNLVSAALEDACGTSKSKLKDMYDSFGDLGDVAQECRHTQSLLVPPSPLLIKDVFSTLHKISLQSGNGSTNRKKNLIVGLMRSCREKEIKYLVRTLVRNLRIGAMMKTILPALAQAVVMNSCATLFSVGSENCKEMFQRLSAAVVEAYNIVPDLDVLIPSLLREGVNFSSHSLKMVPGIPIKPMLAKITNGIPQVLKSFKKKAFTCEYKYDGQRAQIHKLPDGSVHVFSRNGDETTQKFPDVVHIIQDACKPSSSPFVLDAEVVAVDRKNGFKLLSFQLLSSRERGGKGSPVAMDNIKVDVCVYLFDAMLVNGEQLLDCLLRKRRKYLIDLFPRKRPGYLEYANELTVEADDACEDNEETMNRMNAFFENAFQSSCEGIMVKTLDVDAGYYPSKRADTWLKVKRDYVEGLIDSLDLVPIGAWYGNGRKAGWYSPFLMACYNPDTEEFESVCRVMSGFSDSFYIEMKDFFSGEKILTKKPPYYRTNESPDKWFSPELVWQIKGADVTVSPVHQAAVGIVHPSRGVSVRFPRFIRSVTDRRPEDSSTSRDIAEMFHSQTRKMDTNSR